MVIFSKNKNPISASYDLSCLYPMNQNKFWKRKRGREVSIISSTNLLQKDTHKMYSVQN